MHCKTYTTFDIFSKLDTHKKYLEKTMEYRQICTSICHDKMQRKIRDHSFELEKDIDDKLKDFLPFYNRKLLDKILDICKFSDTFMGKYGVEKMHISGSLFWEFLMHLNPFLYKFKKNKEPKTHTDHFIHQFYVYLIGYDFINDKHFKINKGGTLITFRDYIRDYIKGTIKKSDLEMWTEHTKEMLNRDYHFFNKHAPSENRKEVELSVDDKIDFLINETWMLAALFHDGGFPYLIMENIRNITIPNYYSIFTDSDKFIYYGKEGKERRKERRKVKIKRIKKTGGRKREKLTNRKELLNFFKDQFSDYKSQVRKYFDGYFPESLKAYFTCYLDLREKDENNENENNEKIERHGYLAALNILKLFNLFVVDDEIGREDKEEIKFVIKTASEAMFVHDQRLGKKGFKIDLNPFCLLLNIVDDIARLGRLRIKREDRNDDDSILAAHTFIPIIDYDKIRIIIGSSGQIPSYTVEFVKSSESEDDTGFSDEAENLNKRIDLRWKDGGKDAFTIKYTLAKDK